MWWTSDEPRLLFAPLADFTDAPMRRIAADFGAEWCHSEMVNARALADGAHASFRLLVTMPKGESVPCSAQLYGNEPEFFGPAAARIEALGGFSAIDINVGCPMPRIRACGAGAALMESPDTVRRIVESVRAHCSLPVTVKTRLGPVPGRLTAPDILRASADGGASACTIHARYTSQVLSGPLDIPALASVIDLDILPVAANGGIRSGADALDLLRGSGACAVMVGWGAIGNPWLIRAVARSLAAGEPVERESPSYNGIRAMIHAHMEMARLYHARQRELYPDVRDGIGIEDSVVLDFRNRFFRYLKGVPGSNRFRAGLSELKTPDAILAAVDALLEEAKRLNSQGLASAGSRIQPPQSPQEAPPDPPPVG